MDTLLQPKNVVKTKMRSGGTLNSGEEKTHLITNSRKEALILQKKIFLKWV